MFCVSISCRLLSCTGPEKTVRGGEASNGVVSPLIIPLSNAGRRQPQNLTFTSFLKNKRWQAVRLAQCIPWISKQRRSYGWKVSLFSHLVQIARPGSSVWQLERRLDWTQFIVHLQSACELRTKTDEGWRAHSRGKGVSISDLHGCSSLCSQPEARAHTECVQYLELHLDAWANRAFHYGQMDPWGGRYARPGGNSGTWSEPICHINLLLELRAVQICPTAASQACDGGTIPQRYVTETRLPQDNCSYL